MGGQKPGFDTREPKQGATEERDLYDEQAYKRFAATNGDGGGPYEMRILPVANGASTATCLAHRSSCLAWFFWLTPCRR